MRFLSSRKGWVVALLALVAIIAIACGDSATSEPANAPNPTAAATPDNSSVSQGNELTAAEARYINDLQAGWGQFHSKAMNFRSVFAQTYSQKSRLFEALIGAGAGTAFESARAAVAAITPPERYQEEHQLMVNALSDSVAYDQDVLAAAENQDLAGFDIANARLAAIAAGLTLKLSEEVCLATQAADAPFSNCGSEDNLPGGGYGSQLNAIIRQFFADTFARLVQFGPLHEPADILRVEETLLPERADILAKTLGAVNGLQPPVELSADHGRLVAFLEGSSEVNQAQSAALQAEDLAAYRAEADRGLGLFCQTRKDFSDQMKPIVKVLFVDNFGLCGGEPF